MGKGPFKMNGYTYPGTSPMQNNPDEKVVVEATGPSGHGGGIVKSQAMIRLEENKPEKGSSAYAGWLKAYNAAKTKHFMCR